jgi:hypothetical protein
VEACTETVYQRTFTSTFQAKKTWPRGSHILRNYVMPSLQQFKAENEQRKKDSITHISSEDATQRTGYGSDGAKVSQQRKKEEEDMKVAGRDNRGMLASMCAIMWAEYEVPQGTNRISPDLWKGYDGKAV